MFTNFNYELLFITSNWITDLFGQMTDKRVPGSDA